jgi:hypothetical protein
MLGVTFGTAVLATMLLYVEDDLYFIPIWILGIEFHSNNHTLDTNKLS